MINHLSEFKMGRNTQIFVLNVVRFHLFLTAQMFLRTRDILKYLFIILNTKNSTNTRTSEIYVTF